MSHFSVMVVTKSPEDIEKVLQPFHEYECTGIKDEYVVFVDMHDEIVKEYEEKTENKWVEISTGTAYSPYDDRFYHKATIEEVALIKSRNTKGMRYTSDWIEGLNSYKVSSTEPPEGYREEKQSVTKKYPTVEQYAEEYHGYTIENGRIGHWTNPNAKWDWWVIGGRWSNHIRMKKQLLVTDGGLFNIMGFSHAEILNFIKIYKEDPEKLSAICGKYKGKGNDLYFAVKEAAKDTYVTGLSGSDKLGYADQAYKKDIDFAQIEKEAVEAAEDRFDKMWAIVKPVLDAGNPMAESWTTVRKKYEGKIDEARKVYHEQPVVKALHDAPGHAYTWDCPIEQFYLDQEDSRKKYIERRRCSAFTTFAVVKDGKWFQRGEMGWWGIVHNEELEYDWDAKFTELVESLADDDVITIVDCHI